MSSNSEYEQRQFWEQEFLHPAIMHLSAENLSKESLYLINQMVEKAYHMKATDFNKSKK